MDTSGLRPLERRILRLAADGVPDEEIARRFRRSPAFIRRVIELTDVPRSGRAATTGKSLRPLERRVLRWRGHRELVEGLVLCASTRTFMGTARQRMRHESIRLAAALARATSDETARRVALRIMKHMYGDDGFQHWINGEMEKHSWRRV